MKTPLAYSIVPIAPSQTRTRSSSASRKGGFIVRMFARQPQRPEASETHGNDFWRIQKLLCVSVTPGLCDRRVSTARPALSRRPARDEQVGLVPDEVLVAVDRRLVVLAHEDRRHRAGLFAVAAEDAARLVDLVDLRVARAGHHRAVVFRRFEVDRVGRAGHGAEAAGHALFQAVFVPHQHLLAAELREHRDFLVRIVHRDGLAEDVLEGRRKAREDLADHGEIIAASGLGLRPWLRLDHNLGSGSVREAEPSGPTMLSVEPRFLTAQQFLLTTLVFKLAVMALLATMLVRYPPVPPHPDLRAPRLPGSRDPGVLARASR